MVLRALSKCLLSTDRLGASITSLGSLFQGLTTLSVKKCFLTSSLNLPGHSFEPFPGGPGGHWDTGWWIYSIESKIQSVQTCKCSCYWLPRWFAGVHPLRDACSLGALPEMAEARDRLQHCRRVRLWAGLQQWWQRTGFFPLLSQPRGSRLAASPSLLLDQTADEDIPAVQRQWFVSPRCSLPFSCEDY